MDRPLTVLVIEDNAAFRSLALQVFEGCEKIHAHNATSGLEKFKVYCPDITLLDIGLPDKSGLDLLEDLLGYDPEAFIVMLTASSVIADVKKAKERGAAGYIIKPCTSQKIADCIARYHEFRRRITQLTPEERAGNYMTKLRVAAVEEDVAALSQPKSAAAPVAEKAPQSKKPGQPITLPPHIQEVFSQWRVAFVDDYRVNRERAQTQLSKLGCTVDVIESGEALLNMTKQHFYHLIFLDTELPGLDGYKTCKELRLWQRANKKNQSIVIAMIESSYEIENNMWQRAGMDNFIRKPAKFSAVRDMIERQITHYLEDLNAEYVE